VLVFLSVLAVALYKLIPAQIILTSRVKDSILSAYAAKSCLLLARIDRNKNALPYDTLYGLRTKHKKKFGQAQCVYYAVDEESKININAAPTAVLARLPGLDMDLATAITGSQLRPFKFKEELLLIDGMTPEIYDKVKDFVTVDSQGQVNINTAGPEVLAALGFDDDLIGVIKEFRASGKDKVEGTEDDGIFEDPSTIIAQLSSSAGFSSSLEAELLQAISENLITVSSNNLCWHISVRVLNRPPTEVDALVSGNKIKQWRER
jgi:DNA uptake protein ComE-like DNA-binding protein